MFRLIEPSSDQIQNTVLVQSVSAHIVGSHTVYKIILTLKIMLHELLSQYILENKIIYYFILQNKIILTLKIMFY